MKHFTDWLQEGVNLSSGDIQITKRLQMNDGTSLSIQASGGHYCSPRRLVAYDQYSEFEVGFPSKLISALMPFAEDPDNPTETVYGSVPAELIGSIVDSCGGVAGYAEDFE